MRIAIAVAVTCLSIAGVTATAQVQAAIRRHTEIPPESLDLALRTLAKDRGFQLVYLTENVATLQTPGAVGDFTVDEALRRLLSDSRLEYKFVDDNTVSIFPMANSTSALAGDGVQTGAKKNDSAGSSSKRSSDDRVRLAQVDRGSDTQTPAVGTGAALDDSARKDQITEIVVTAQKREERLQDVPMSIAVLGGKDLDKSSYTSVLDALASVPGVATAYNGQGGGSLLIIRGVSASDPLFSGDSPVAYYMDSVPFGLVRTAIVPDSNTYDLDRIEVLRGPQGTLYGANALNGVVRVLTKDADLNDFDFKARTSLSTTDGGGENYGGDFAVNMPIVEGKLAVRAVVGDDKLSGWVNNSDQTHINDTDQKNQRIKVTAKPTDDTTIHLTASRFQGDYGGPSESDGNRNAGTPLPQPSTTDYSTYGAEIDQQFSLFSISSATSYLTYKNGAVIDLDSGSVPPAPLPLLTAFSARVFSEEINLASKLSGPWKWSAGAFYRDGKDRTFQNIPVTPPILTTPIDFSDTSKSSAIYGEVGRSIGEQFELSVGLRQFHDQVSTRENQPFNGPGIPLTYASESFNATTPRVLLTWTPGRDLMVYASFSQGFRSGSPQDFLVLTADPVAPATKPDKLSNYEIGAKGTLFDRLVTYETALYYMNWKDVQQPIEIPYNGLGVTATINGERASGVGFDFATTLHPTSNWDIGVAFSWNNLAQDDSVYSGGVLIFNKGDRLNFSPRTTAAVSTHYALPLGGSGYLVRLGVSENYVAPMEIRTLEGTSAVTQSGNSVLLARGTLSLEAPKNWTASLFVDNAANWYGTPVPSYNDTLPQDDTRIRPRTIGLHLDYQFR